MQNLTPTAPIFLITHNLAQAKHLGDHAVFMGNEGSLLDTPTHPQTRRFIDSFFH
jgi:ABC-type phosphate transport system ATPase subunit